MTGRDVAPGAPAGRPALAASAAFLGAVVAANALTEQFGTVPLGLGLTATAGTFAAGATFTLRDTVHDRHGPGLVCILILAGAALSAIVSPALAVASGAAFLVSEAADLVVYAPLRARQRDVAVWASALVGSIVDSALFLALAFGAVAVTRDAVAGQVAAKLAATVPVWLALRRRAR